MIKLVTNKYFKVLLYFIPLLLNIVLFLFIDKELGSGFINVNDGALLFTKIEVSKKFFILWSENNLGYVNSLFAGINFFSHLYSVVLLKFNFSIKWIELTIYFICTTGIFYSSWYAFYLIQQGIFDKSKNIFFPFLAAFFYSYNIYNISLIGIIDSLFLLEVLYPYLLYILISLLDEEISIKHILALSLIIGFTMSVPIFSFAVYLCLFLPFIFFKKNVFKIKNVLSVVSIFIIALLLDSPLVYSLIHAYITPDPYSHIQFKEIGYIFPPYGIMGVFQFFSDWLIVYINSYANLYFKSAYGIISSYMIWVLILTTLVIYWRSIKNKRVLLFLTLSLVFAMFLSKGGQKPFDSLNTWMYNINPIFAIFRTSGSKFGQPIMLILSVLILYILNINRNKLLPIIIGTTIFMQTWVFFNPINIIGESTAWWNKPVVNISKDYTDLVSYLNTDTNKGTVLFYPGLSSSHYDLKNGVKFSFQDVLGKYIERPLIYPDYTLQLSLAKKTITDIVKNFDPKLIGNSSIRYIVIRQDFDSQRVDEKVEVKRVLKIIEANNFKKVFTSKLFTVFEVNNEYFRDIITIKTPEGEYAPDFTKITPYNYVVNVKIKDILGNKIVFRNNYHPDWKILDLEKNGLKAKQNLTDSFANGWQIEKSDSDKSLNPDQNIKLNVYFYPQKILFFLSVVSLTSLGALLSLCLFLIIRKRKIQ